MAYVDGSFLNPTSNFSFNPKDNKTNASGNDSTISITDNPYVPTCSDQDSTLINNHHDQVASYANQFGQTISYQPVKYSFNTHNFLYGEDPVSGYHYARKLKAIVDFKSYTTFITRFGMMSDSELVVYISIKEFEKVWGPSKGAMYPLNGDIFIIDSSACDRPLGQTPMCWEVVEKDDKINPTDFMGRHYYWKLTCKRFEYSYEKNATEERFLDDTPGDTKEFGRLPGGENPPDLGHKEYDVDDFAKNNFNQPNSTTYGNYL